jgi:diguanylate cyclase (GGDEF)-like protein/PAS domain S-box-containing protein
MGLPFPRHRLALRIAMPTLPAPIAPSEIHQILHARRQAPVRALSGERHRPLAGALLEASLTLDHKLRVLDASPGVQRLMGFAMAPQPGRLLAETCDDREFLAAVAVRSDGARPQRAMLVRAGLDADVRHLLVQVVPLGPAPSGRLVLISDATRQVQLEDDLMAATRVLDSIAEGVLLVDTAGWRVRQANAPALVILGLDSADLPGLCFEHLQRRLRAENGAQPAAEELAALTEPAEFRYQRPDGAVLAVEVRVERLRLARREVLALMFRDIGERIRAAAELRAASSRCGITFSQAATGLAHVTLDGRWARVNRKLSAILGYTEAELLEMPVDALTHPQDRDADAAARERMLDGELPYATREKRYLRKDGEPVWVSVTGSLARDEQGNPSHFVAMIEDIGERKRADERIRHLATHDVLTGLPNRAGLHEHLEQALDAASRNRRRLGVVFLDMDKLKTINDTLGHEEGDRALIRFARHLQQVVRSGDLVARLGGDEFVVVLGDIAARADINSTLQRTLFAPAQPDAPPGPGASASCSIGISIFPDDGQDARTLIRNADLAMYRAKQRGGGSYEFFSPETIR